MSLRGGAPWLAGGLAAGSIHYALNDGAIDSSELIRKAWNRAGGTPLGALTTPGDLHWRQQEAVIRRIENGGLPLDRQMITPWKSPATRDSPKSCAKSCKPRPR